MHSNWGTTSKFTVSKLAYMYSGTAACVPEAVPCIQLCGLNSITCKISAYMHK